MKSTLCTILKILSIVIAAAALAAGVLALVKYLKNREDCDLLCEEDAAVPEDFAD